MRSPVPLLVVARQSPQHRNGLQSRRSIETHRGHIKVLPREKDSVRREFLKRLAGAFEANGIKGP